MLHDFLTDNRAELIERCRQKTARRLQPKAMPDELFHGIPQFLDQIIKTLKIESSDERPTSGDAVSGPSGGGGGNDEVPSEVGATAALHGRELLYGGFTVDQVVHDYGDLCQAVTDLAFEHDAPIEVDEFRTLNRCLDNGIADAVTEYATQRDSQAAADGARELNERLGSLAHDLRNHVHTAMLAVAAIKAGQVGLTGATGAVLDRSLTGLRNLIDRSLAEVRITAGMPPRHQLFALSEFVADVRIAASLEATSLGCKLVVSDVGKGLAIDADRDMLFSAISNLLQNAFKYTEPGSEVTLRVHSAGDRVLLDVEDHCGGLPPSPEKLFLPFAQTGAGKSGMGLGLSICRRTVEANKGVLRVRDVPGSGCVFTIDLPQQTLRD